MIISQDPTGLMPEPDAAGQIILANKSYGNISGSLLLGIFGVLGIILWCIYFLDPNVRAQHPGLLAAAMLWSIFILLLPLAIISLIRGPASLAIDDTGIAWLRNGRRAKQIIWSDIQEVKLEPSYTTGQGQPIMGGNKYVTNQIQLIGQNAHLFRLPNFGINPATLADYVLKQQNKMSPNKPAIFTDNSLPEIFSQRLQFKDSIPLQNKMDKKSKPILLFFLIALVAAGKIAVIFLRNHH